MRYSEHIRRGLEMVKCGFRVETSILDA